jgi:hypothetical protein
MRETSNIYGKVDSLIRPFTESINRRISNPLDSTRHFLKVSQVVGFKGSLVLFCLIEKEALLKEQEAFRAILNKPKNAEESENEKFTGVYVPPSPKLYEDGFFSLPSKIIEKVTNLSSRDVHNSIKKLNEIVFIKTTKRGLPSINCYKIMQKDINLFLIDEDEEVNENGHR